MKPKILFICTFVFFLIGCKTGGVRVGEDSAGKIIKPKTIYKSKEEIELSTMVADEQIISVSNNPLATVNPN